MEGKCIDCEFCFPNDEKGFICAGEQYGESVTDSLHEMKPCYEEGLDAFIRRTKEEEVAFIQTTLAQLPVDGRKKFSCRTRRDGS